MDHFKLYQGNIIASAKLFSPDPTPDLKPTLSGVRFNGLARDPTILARASLALRDDPHCVGFPKSSPHLSSTDYEALDDLYQVRDLLTANLRQ